MSLTDNDTKLAVPAITVSTRLPKDLHAAVRLEADKLHVTDSWVVREIVREYFERPNVSILAR